MQIGSIGENLCYLEPRVQSVLPVRKLAWNPFSPIEFYISPMLGLFYHVCCYEAVKMHEKYLDTNNYEMFL